MDFQKLINANIKRLRKKLNLTQEQWAEQLSMSSQAVSNLERNQYMPTAKTINNICEKYNITPEYLCLPLENDISKQEEIRAINIILNNLDKESLTQIKKIIETFNNK